MRILIFLLFIFLSSCGPTTLSNEALQPPNGVESNIPPTLDLNDKSVMYINGVINDDTVILVREKYKNIKYLVLNSPGGIADAAYNVSIFVKYYNIITVILKNGRCESACTLIFQAGKERHASATSTIMYHGSRMESKFMEAYFTQCPIVTEKCLTIFESMKDFIVKSTIDIFEKLEKYGLSPEVFLLLQKQPIEPKWLRSGNLTGYTDLRFTAEESMQYKAVTHIVEYNIR